MKKKMKKNLIIELQINLKLSINQNLSNNLVPCQKRSFSCTHYKFDKITSNSKGFCHFYLATDKENVLFFFEK